MTFFPENKLSDIYQSLAWGYKSDFELNFKKTQLKSRLLAIGHVAVIAAAVFLFTFAILFAVHKYTQPHVVQNYLF